MSAVVNPINDSLILLVADHRNSDGVLAHFIVSLVASGVSPNQVAHLDTKPLQAIAPQLEQLGQAGKSLILLGHVGDGTMGGHSAKNLASLLVEKGLPTDTAKPIPVLVLGCDPLRRNLDGAAHHFASELLIALGTKRVNATAFCFDPRVVSYSTSTGQETNEWYITSLSTDKTRTGMSWIYSGVPWANREQLMKCKEDLAQLTVTVQAEEQAAKLSRTQVSQARGALVPLQQQEQSVKNELLAINQKISELEKEIFPLAQQLSMIKRGLVQEQPQQASQADSHSRVLSLLTARTAAPRSAPVKASMSAVEMQAKLDPLNEELQKSKEERAALNTKLEELRAQVAQATDNLAQRSQELAAVTARANALNEQISECRGKIEKMYLVMLRADNPWSLVTTQFKSNPPSQQASGLDASLLEQPHDEVSVRHVRRIELEETVAVRHDTYSSEEVEQASQANLQS